MKIEIPNYATIDIRHIVCDYNGTIAKDGMILPHLKTLLQKLSEEFTIHVITADTFGSVTAQLAECPVSIKILETDDHTKEKMAFVRSLGEELCVALGNGNNDEAMLKSAKLGIAVTGDEGCSTKALMAADIVCRDISDALELLLHPKRLTATLRR
ncbi:HAD family hydrolase [Hydrogenimonas urashimensis]|uniref:HAD family hydrolase n=1 Tax=Hydrogenimonas urashimensis TaxID=2740515 RepID=UPI001915C4C1|nr:haloacid dehalogenase [Hydrogenimonas urashimensis]